MTLTLRVLIPLALIVAVAGCGFATTSYSPYNPPGFFLGLWHGLLAPWTLIVRLFLDIKMYAFPNIGWFYDLGFVIGAAFSVPVGWIATIIALVMHLFFLA